VSATLVKRLFFCNRLHGKRVRLLDVPGATPKKPFSGLMA
jgi:hypothetical protein